MDSNNIVLMPIKNGILKISACDYEKADKHKWIYYSWNNVQRVYTYLNKSMCTFQKIVFGVKNKQLVLHKNGDFLDFTRDNIVICNRSEMIYLLNHINESDETGYYGVYFYKCIKKWRVSIMKKGTKKHGGNYETEYDAAIAADFLAIKKYGELAKRNFTELTLDELEKKYEELQRKYGYTYSEKLSKGIQGTKRNQTKSSKYVGVTWNKINKKWMSQISYKKNQYYLGYFDSEEEAAKAYNQKALELYGQYAKINEISQNQ